jgi:hypothetical protein
MESKESVELLQHTWLSLSSFSSVGSGMSVVLLIPGKEIITGFLSYPRVSNCALLYLGETKVLHLLTFAGGFRVFEACAARGGKVLKE